MIFCFIKRNWPNEQRISNLYTISILANSFNLANLHFAILNFVSVLVVETVVIPC